MSSTIYLVEVGKTERFKSDLCARCCLYQYEFFDRNIVNFQSAATLEYISKHTIKLFVHKMNPTFAEISKMNSTFAEIFKKSNGIKGVPAEESDLVVNQCSSGELNIDVAKVYNLKRKVELFDGVLGFSTSPKVRRIN